MRCDGEAIVRQARTWVGTRFRHQGRLKRAARHAGGVDCLGLIVGVAAELDLRDRRGRPLHLADERDYSKSPDGAYLTRRLEAALPGVESADMRAGDIALFAWDGNPQHLAIVTSYPRGGLGLLHAYAPARRVVEHRLDAAWENRLRAAFRVGL